MSAREKDARKGPKDSDNEVELRLDRQLDPAPRPLDSRDHARKAPAEDEAEPGARGKASERNGA